MLAISLMSFLVLQIAQATEKDPSDPLKEKPRPTFETITPDNFPDFHTRLKKILEEIGFDPHANSDDFARQAQRLTVNMPIGYSVGTSL